MATRAPPSALEPYLRLPPETSLILLTGTLGCSANWLLSRYVGNHLSLEDDDHSTVEPSAVLLVSWLRDATFWKSEIRRTTGLDLTKAIHTNRFTFLDLLTTPTQDYQNLTKRLIDAITTLRMTRPTSKLILLLDSPDIALATSSLTSQSLSTLLLTVRSQVHCTILSCSADLPLLSAATQSTESWPTPIEVESAAFLASQAHSARMVMSVRELETGAAKDVSGVLRVTRGGGCEAFDHIDGDGSGEVREAELLYLVQRDGNVKVFIRGNQ
ncbi:hypothetical protein DOTSEDRAFT_29050 [Dothistroma septosporum NZE10]|uniref:EF-hand domain-containing protein n=1 Tax=Dothistroma septosporum (strain NZE10 / CBS 128990) TaxID=675120 RepID=M2YIU7_DOTSN|nr:hypothetical protein DOTSEDRAFT_29050 [Dothistroma septosporum NZE10]